MDEFPPIFDWEEFLDKSKIRFEENWKKSTVPSIPKESFELIRTLGYGAFGRVVLIKLKKSSTYYALKAIDKAKLVKMRQVDHAMYEKRVLQSIHFPFAVYLVFFLQDPGYIYFIMPYIAGGELFSYLRRRGRLDEMHAKFYGAQIVLTFEYLHSLDLVYRDLKPENVLIDSRGYLKLTDFGFCKLIKGRTYTFCGTPEYVSPEVILQKGYGMSVDFWALGVFIFELNSGHTPFYHQDHIKLYEKILSGKFKTEVAFTAELKEIIRDLLQVDITKRLGVMKNGIQDIKEHKWFRDIPWLAILNRKLDAPYVPKCLHPGDTSNFDKYEEEPMVSTTSDKYAREFRDF